MGLFGLFKSKKKIEENENYKVVDSKGNVVATYESKNKPIKRDRLGRRL